MTVLGALNFNITTIYQINVDSSYSVVYVTPQPTFTLTRVSKDYAGVQSAWDFCHKDNKKRRMLLEFSSDHVKYHGTTKVEDLLYQVEYPGINVRYHWSCTKTCITFKIKSEYAHHLAQPQDVVCCFLSNYLSNSL